MKKIISLSCIVVSLFFISFLSSCTADSKDKGTDTKTEPLIVRSRLRADPGNLNPLLSTKNHSLHVSAIIFPTLIQYDPVSYKVAPVIAKSAPVVTPITEGPNKGGATYLYEIHEEAVWDDGKPVLATDYIFSLKALFNPMVHARVYQGLLNFIKDVKIDPENPRKFTVYTNRTFRALTNGRVPLYPEHIYDPTKIMRPFSLEDLTNTEKLDELKKDTDIIAFAEKFNKIGTPDSNIQSCGAYRLVEWETDQQVILEKKKNWWGEKLRDQYPLLAVYPDEIIFKIIPDDVAAITAMKDEQVDVSSRLSSAAFKEFKESDAGKPFHFYNPDFPMFMYMGLNTKLPKLADKKVRRALAHLTDVKEIIESIQLGMAVPCVSSFPPKASYTNKKLQAIDFNIEKAKLLLTEAGWKDSDGDGIVDKIIKGKKTALKIKVLHTSSEVSTNIVAIMKEDARKAGVNIESNIVAAGELFKTLSARNFDAYTLAGSFDLDLYDPESFWHTSNDTPSGQNRSGFGSKKTDAIIEAIHVTEDEARRKELYFELQEIIYQEQPFIFLYNPLDRVVISKRFKQAKTTLRSPGYLEPYFY